MSDATTRIRKALDPGVEMRFVDGQLKVTGKRKAVECWAPRLRQHKAELIEALQAPEPVMDWRELDRAYLAHHVMCKTCQAAGRGRTYGLRCGVGAALWSSYSTAATGVQP